MPNIKSAKKRVLVSKVRNARNRAMKTALRTNIKKFDTAVAVGGDQVTAAYTEAIKGLDKAVAKGIMHKNTAARKKSQITKKLNAAN